MMWWHIGWGPWGWLWMALSMALFWALVVAAVLLVVRWTGRSTAREAHPERLLAARFANGEIDADEYASRLGRLRAEREDTQRPKTAT